MTRPNTLYDLNHELIELWRDKDELDETTFKDTWEALALERAEKIDATLSYIKCLKSWSESCRVEQKKLKERADSYEHKAKVVTDWLSRCLQPRERFVNGRHEISWKESTETNVTVPASELPEAFRRVKIEPDKTAIKAYIQGGGTVPGCSLQKKLNLGIK